jgi:hypothetical protein
MFAVAIAGVGRAVQVSFQGPAPHAPSEPSGDELAGLRCSAAQSRKSDGLVHGGSLGWLESAASDDAGRSARVVIATGVWQSSGFAMALFLTGPRWIEGFNLWSGV